MFTRPEWEQLDQLHDNFQTSGCVIAMRVRFEFRYTPKHGSWLNMAEIEIGALSRQCLRRRIPDRDTMLRETVAWVERRNAAGGTVDWRFTTANARVKLKSPYPSIQ